MSFPKGFSGVVSGLLLGAVLGSSLLVVRFGGIPFWSSTLSDVGDSVVSAEIPVDENGDATQGVVQTSDGNLIIERGNAIVQATRKVAPAVVSITVLQAQHVRDATMEQWERMGLIPRRDFHERVRSMGSGVIISEDGYIVTNSHVLDGAVQVVVTLSNGSQYQAQPVDIIDTFDLAVLKIEGNGFPVAAFAHNDQLDIGEWAIAIGSPYGYLLADTQPTVTVGVISALNRDIKRKRGEREYLGMIQTDAAINPGNSGGPLVNTSGEIIGINTFIFSDNGGSVGIGFAVPATRVQQVLTEIKRYGHYRQISMGFSVQQLSPGMMQYLGLDNPDGFLVLSVLPGSPAWKSGLRPRDVIREVEGFPLTSADIWHRLIYEAQVGDSLVFRAERNKSVFNGIIIIEEYQ